MGQAGGASGYSRVANISNLGEQTLLDLPGIVSGQIGTITGNSTHLWVTTKPTVGGNGNSNSATGILKGHFLSNGTVEWDYGWSFPGSATAYDAELVGQDLYFATTDDGFFKLNSSGQLSKISGTLHQNLDGIVRYGNELIVGLAAQSGSSPGIQRFSLQSHSFTFGRLVAGLPSNVVNGFGSSANYMYIATDNGVGVWNYSTEDWEDSITSGDGLPSSIVNDIYVSTGTNGQGDVIYFATADGIVRYDENSKTLTVTDKSNGIAGDSTWMLTTMTTSSGSIELVASHDGRGDERPGVSLLDISGSVPMVNSTHKFDQLPSNSVLSLTSDWWGVHISTTNSQTMIHWNSSSGDFEEGQGFTNLNSWWPATKSMSNGNHIVAISGNNGLSILEARTSSHSILHLALPPEGINEVRQGLATSTHFWFTTESGLIGIENNGQYNAVDDFILRRALPLQIATAGGAVTMNITEMTNVGQRIQLIDSTNPIQLNLAGDQIGPGNSSFTTVPLMFTSPVDNAKVWTKLINVEYNAILNFSTDPMLESNLQFAIDSSILLNNTQHVSLTLQSPQNGSVLVRLVYDYVRKDTPLQITQLYDRPDDGGSTLMVEWSLIHDPDFSQYLIFLNEGPWVSSPTEADLMSITPDKVISLHSRTGTDVSTANGQPLIDGNEYYATIVTQYNDGRWGNIPLPIGPATPDDDIPRPPDWARAEPHSNGEDGELELEWARCSALDLASTNVYVSKSSFTDVFGLQRYSTLDVSLGNTSIISLTPQTPYWIGFTCEDAAGQENKSDVTVIGPIVPTGELNDNEAPPPVEGTEAQDVPDDEGGRIIVSWNTSSADDCSFYIIFMKQGDHVDGVEDMMNVEGYSQADIVSPCEETQTIVSSLDGVPLIDGQMYTVGVVAYDDWLNGNTNTVKLVTATPLQNVVGQGSTPDRITNIKAFDHPDDDGTAIDVIWTPSTAEDFSSYTIWVADKPLEDISWLYASRGMNEETCGCFSFSKQWIDERTNPIELTISTALYDGQDLLATTPQLIKPDIELFVVVTVHDLKGNVHLDELVQAKVTPIDNINDITPPARIDSVRISDVPNDDGSAIFIDFDLSSASDIASYEIYGATWAFQGIALGEDGPSTPLQILDRNPELPMKLELLAGDTPILAGLDIWVAVVARDGSGNAFETDLNVANGQSIDNGGFSSDDPLTPPENIKASWVDETEILVQWQAPEDFRIDGMQIFILDQDFTTTDEALFVGEVLGSSTFMITKENFENLANTSQWYIAVTPFNDFGIEKSVTPILLNTIDANPIDQNGDADGTEFSLNSLVTQEVLLAIGLALIATLLLILVVRRKNVMPKGVSKDWQLQESTWGIDNDWNEPSYSSTPVTTDQLPQQPQNVISQQPQYGQYGREMYTPQQPILQPVQQNQVQSAPQPSSPIDTSFLDDLL